MITLIQDSPCSVRVLAGWPLFAIAVVVTLGMSALDQTVAMTSQPQEKLIRHLRSPEPFKRAHAAHLLRKLKPAPEAIPGLVGLMGDRTPVELPEEDKTDPGRESARTLGAYGELAVDALISAFSSNSLEVRRDALKGLAFTRSPRAYPELVAALSDPAWRIREEAAQALGLFGHDTQIGDLTGALHDPHESVREKVVWSLGMIGDRNAVPELIEALTDEDTGVRSRAAWSLGMIGDWRALNALRAVKQDRHEDKEVRAQTERALAMINTMNVPAMGIRTLSGNYTLAPGQGLKVGLKYGSFRIVAEEIEQVQAEIRVECREGGSQCDELLSRVQLLSRETSKSLWLDIEYLFSETAKEQLSVEAILKVPTAVPDLEINLSAGTVTMELPQSAVSRVRLQADVGKPQLKGHGIEDRIRHRTLGQVGHEVMWSGFSGSADVVVKVGIGSILLRLK